MANAIESIRIENAENGYMVVCHYEQNPTKTKSSGLSASAYQEPERYVFRTPEEVCAKVRTLLGGKMRKASGSRLADVGER